MPTKMHSTYGELVEPGDFVLTNWESGSDGVRPTRLIFKNPACKRFDCCEISIKFGDCKAPLFGWDGNLEAPTITPSIGCDHRCGWHGHITNGEILP